MNQVFSCDQIQDVSERLLSYARSAGADESAVSINGSCSSLIRYSRNQISENGEQNAMRVSLAVAVGKQEACFSASLSPNLDLSTFANQAVALARMFPENPEHVSPVKSVPGIQSNCFDQTITQRSPLETAELIDRVCKKSAHRNLFSYGTLTAGNSFYSIANSAGLRAYHSETRFEFTITVRTQDHSGSCRNTVSHHLYEKLAIDDTLEKTMDWAERSRDPSPIDPGEYTVILTPTAATSYFMLAMSAFDARMVEEGRSALTHHYSTKDPIGQQLFSPLVSIRSRLNHPDHPRAPFSQTISMDGYSGQGMANMMFSMGLPVSNRAIIENGTLKHLFHSLYWARHKNVEPYGFPTLLEFDAGSKSTDEMIQGTERGLLINSFWYIRFVDPTHLLLTGLTRDGVFLIENGQIVRPVKNLRFNESPLSSLQHVVEIGQSERRDAWYAVVLMPTMKVDQFTFSVETDAV